MTPLPYRLISGLLGLVACLTFNSCESPGSSSGSGYDNVVDYTPTSRMSKKEKENYAFDENGKYRENWVAANSGGRVKKDTTSMSTDSPYVQEDTPSNTGYTPGRVSSPAYADTPAVTPRMTTASTSSGTKKSKSSSSGSRKSVASRSSGSKKNTASAKSKKSSSKPAGKPAVVTIKSGDTLYSLSRKSGVSVEKIKSYNGMKSDLLVDGRTIKIPPKKK